MFKACVRLGRRTNINADQRGTKNKALFPFGEKKVRLDFRPQNPSRNPNLCPNSLAIVTQFPK
jgi:hypothetical protein